MLKRWYQLLVVLVLAVFSHTVTADEYLSLSESTNSVPLHIELVEALPVEHIADEGASEEGSATNDYLGSPYYSLPRRAFSDNQDLTVHLSPNYYLLIAFLPPSLLEISKQDIAIASPLLHWTSRVSTSLSRLSGWKDGNALYSHRLPHTS
ncbi:hypothetical protein RCJ22_05820 [Vibrio sp. FNV 38]|nr:hypothetical protein [Vibrio sp. FNV 38]